MRISDIKSEFNTLRAQVLDQFYFNDTVYFVNVRLPVEHTNSPLLFCRELFTMNIETDVAAMTFPLLVIQFCTYRFFECTKSFCIYISMYICTDTIVFF